MYQENIIPLPVSYEKLEEILHIEGEVSFEVLTEDSAVKQYTNLFKESLSSLNIKTTENSPVKIAISLNEPNDTLGKEGYELELKQKAIEISAKEPAGIFNAFQTLKQLFPFSPEEFGEYSIQACKIIDYPRFEWRGLMLDVSRHFFSVEEVKAYLDKMSQYKLNTFHWHLTDDEGWRIEIKSLPKLTEVGAWRVERHGRFGKTRPFPKPNEKKTYGGFYTQDQIKDIVKYASERNITIVPEIDVPGHMLAALAAYPELSIRILCKRVL